ncbi:MAG: AI-2E family transporter [Candidatus Dormiibacterota bacterium]
MSTAGNGSSRSVWEERPAKILVWLLIAVAVVVLFQEAEFVVAHVFNVLLLFIFAAVIALLLTPVVDRMQRLRPFRNHRGLAVLTLYTVGVAIVAGVVVLVTPSLFAQAKQLPSLMDQLQAQLQAHGISFQLSSITKAFSGAQLGVALGVASTLLTTVASIVLILVISIYLCIEGRVLVATARNLLPNHQKQFDFVSLAVGSTLVAYVRGQLIMSCIIGVYTGTALTLLGVNYGILLGVAAFFLEFVPIVGAVVAMAVAVVVAVLQSPTLAVLALIVGLLGHALDAYVLGPRINGKVTQLHALVAMAALLIGAEVAGILGALFAVPVAALANIFLGAAYRARRGEKRPMSTGHDGAVTVETLPRLGEEVGGVEDAGVVESPVPRGAASSGARRTRTPRRPPAAQRPSA